MFGTISVDADGKEGGSISKPETGSEMFKGDVMRREGKGRTNATMWGSK